MASKHLNNIFLSASIPSLEGGAVFFDFADVVAIRDSVRALATVVIPTAHLIWGGHPSITPLIRYVMEKMSSNLKQHVTLYQSLYYQDKFPPDNFDFEGIKLTPTVPNDEDKSIALMRQQMLKENEFSAAVFIGGMDGVLDEYELFTTYHPAARCLPIASTGGAARILYDRSPEKFELRLSTDYAYMTLFRDLLEQY